MIITYDVQRTESSLRCFMGSGSRLWPRMWTEGHAGLVMICNKSDELPEGFVIKWSFTFIDLIMIHVICRMSCSKNFARTWNRIGAARLQLDSPVWSTPRNLLFNLRNAFHRWRNVMRRPIQNKVYMMNQWMIGTQEHDDISKMHYRTQRDLIKLTHTILCKKGNILIV